MSENDATGSLMESNPLSRTIESNAPQPGADGHTHETACLNCAAPLTGPYCRNCGQHAHVHRTLAAFFHDLLHGVFHFEGKTWRTLPLLAWRPGELTRRYVAGQRARFVSPLALFLFSVFVMVAVISSMAPIVHVDQNQISSKLSANATETANRLATLQRQRAAAALARQPTAALDEEIKEAAGDARMMDTLSRNGMVKGTALRLSDDVPGWLREPIERAAANPDLALYKLKGSAYKWSWALIPLSVPFLWLLFPFSRRFHLYDHSVFVTYSLAFMTLLTVALTLWNSAGLPGTAVAALVIPPVHMFRQLRGAYSLSWSGAAWRTVLLVTLAMVTLLIFALLVSVVGLVD